MAPADALTLSFDLGLAALVAKSVYNFGELLQHPVVARLESTEHAWLAQVLRVFNAGDIEMYEQLIGAHRAQLEAQPALVAHAAFLKEKIALMSLMELVFSHVGPGADHTLTFELVAQRTRLPLVEVRAAAGLEPAADARTAPQRTRSRANAHARRANRRRRAQVELLLMRAMSLGLIRGVIDEIEQLVTVSWVQPRVLTSAQVANMAELLQSWKAQVGTTLKFLEAEAPEFGQDANF